MGGHRRKTGAGVAEERPGDEQATMEEDEENGDNDPGDQAGAHRGALARAMGMRHGTPP